MCRGLPSQHNKAKEMGSQIMKWKRNDADYQLKHILNINKTEWEVRKLIMEKHGVRKQYSQVWQRERERITQLLKRKRQKKVEHLYNKQKHFVKPKYYIDGITVRDQNLDDTFESKPRVYGGIDVNKEIDVLSLNPKFAVYENVNMINFET